MKRLIALSFPLLLSASAFASGFAAGDLAVVRVANGVGALGSVATAAYLDEYTPGGTFVQTINLPTATSGANLALTLTGSGVNEGYLELSANGVKPIRLNYGDDVFHGAFSHCPMDLCPVSCVLNPET